MTFLLRRHGKAVDEYFNEEIMLGMKLVEVLQKDGTQPHGLVIKTRKASRLTIVEVW